MIKLLKADSFRLKEEAIFWSFILVTIIGAGYRILRSAHDIPIDTVLYDYIGVIGFCIALFVSVFVGKERSEGIIRNKIIVGHSRTSIYLSNLIISIVVSVLCEFLYIAFMLLIGSHIYKKLQMSISQLCMILLNAVLIIATYCSIFNLISMMCPEATTSVIICVITFIIMCAVYVGIEKIADSPKYFTSTSWENGVSTTNNLITIDSEDKDVKQLVISLNRELKNLRIKELQCENGNQELKRLITDISHDLRTPLTAINGYAELLEEETLSKKQKDYIKIIRKKTNELTLLIKQLKDVSVGIELEKI